MAFLAGAALSTAASAGAPVEESNAVPPAATAPRAAAIAEEPAGRDQGIATLYYQLQVLQDDVRRLQGIVEEQNYRIERLVAEQRERYLELDERLLALTNAGGRGSVDPPPSAAGDLVPSTERGAYNAAFAVVKNAAGLALPERREAYRQALAMFAALIGGYPNGEFTPNAYYWTGEAQLFLGEPELARQAFVQVVNLFGDHAKVPDALYKLGVVYHQLEDTAGALHYLDRVIAEFPTHTAARLARDYAAELR